MTSTVIPESITFPVPPRAKLVLSGTLPDETAQELLGLARERLGDLEEVDKDNDADLLDWILALVPPILTDPDEFSFWYSIFETDNFVVTDES